VRRQPLQPEGLWQGGWGAGQGLLVFVNAPEGGQKFASGEPGAAGPATCAVN